MEHNFPNEDFNPVHYTLISNISPSYLEDNTWVYVDVE